MIQFKEFIRQNKLIAGILLFCLSIRLFLYRPQAIGWDESTYVLIGKYLFSAGQIGFLEPFRPIVWPFLLGLFWKLGFDSILLGYILAIFFSLGNLVCVYCIGKKVYGASVGALAALLLGISPSFFFWGNSILTEMPASFLGLLSVYYALNRKYALSGIVGTTAFFTKFTGSLTSMAVGVFIALRNARKMTLRPAAGYVLGCALVFSVAMFCFLMLYGDVSLPFAHSRLIYTQTHYNWLDGILYVLKVLPHIENWLLVFVLVNLFSLYRERTAEKIFLLGVGFLQFVWVGKLPTEISRFLLMALPYLYLLTANGILQSYELLRSKGLRFLLAAAVFVQLGIQGYGTMTIRFAPNQLTVFQRYIKSHEANIRGSIWISSPTMLAYSNLKADETMYYPAFDLKKISELSSKLNRADFIFVDNANLRCEQSGPACRSEKNKFLDAIKQDFEHELYYEDPASGRMLAVFKAKKI